MSSFRVFAVKKNKGTSLLISLISFANVKPSLKGSITSNMHNPKSFFLNFSNPSIPFLASVTLYECSFKKSFKIAPKLTSSSTSKIFFSVFFIIKKLQAI